MVARWIGLWYYLKSSEKHVKRTKRQQFDIWIIECETITFWHYYDNMVNLSDIDIQFMSRFHKFWNLPLDLPLSQSFWIGVLRGFNLSMSSMNILWLSINSLPRLMLCNLHFVSFYWKIVLSEYDMRFTQ